MKKVLFLMLFLTITGLAEMDAQVKMGENAVPQKGTVLDLNSLYKGGLLLPNVDITDFRKIPETFSDKSVADQGNIQALAGMVVWNSRKGWEGIYAWDGNEWKRLSGNPTAVDPKKLTPGSGSFKGRPCFDVALSNPGGKCGELDLRQDEELAGNGARADFTKAITRNQPYRFTPSGVVSNVRFYYVEDDANKDQIVESISGGNMANNIDASIPVTCNIVYKNNLNTPAEGRTTENALKVAIYVVYNDGPTNNGKDVMLKQDVTIKDCSCCGAYTTAGSWLTFMCYNLGADKKFVTPEQQMAAATSLTSGKYFQWGQKKAWTAGSVSGWSSSGGNTNDAAWGNGTIKNTLYDPCPDGYRVPSQAQWESIIRANPSTWSNTVTPGWNVGSSLFLPAAGSLNWSTGAPSAMNFGYYWSSSPLNERFSSLTFNTAQVYYARDNDPNWGFTLRCVVD